jgi:hypothetical protein
LWSKKKQSCTSTPLVGFHGLLQGEFYLFRSFRKIAKSDY